MKIRYLVNTIYFLTLKDCLAILPHMALTDQLNSALVDHFMAFYDICHMTKNVINHSNMGIKITASSRQTDIGILNQ